MALMLSNSSYSCKFELRLKWAFSFILIFILLVVHVDLPSQHEQLKE